jgi:hypothetical protein
MDSSVVNALAEKYKGINIRVTPSVMDEIGIEKKGTHLEIEEFQLSCIPFDISLQAINLLAVLNQKEIGFFESMAKGKSQKLRMVFNTKDASKPVSFFIRLDRLVFKKPSPESPYSFIETTFKEAPFSYKEILVDYIRSNEEAEEYFKQAPDEAVDEGLIRDILGSVRLSALKDDLIADRLRVVALSPKRIKLFGEFDGPPPAQGEIVEFEPDGVKAPGGLKCACTSMTAFPDVPGYYWMEGELQFVPWLYSGFRKRVPLPARPHKK